MGGILGLILTGAPIKIGGNVSYPTYASTYYVRKTGNDTTGDGSSASPWLTIGKAVKTVPIGGDSLILVGDGTYKEFVDAQAYLYFSRAFTNWIEVRAESGPTGDVTIQGNDHPDNTIRFDSAARIRFRFLKVLPENLKNNATIWLRINTHHIEFYNCHITQLVSASPSRLIVNASPTGTENINNILFKDCTFAMSGEGNNAEVRFLRTGAALNATLDSITVDRCISDSPIRLLGSTNCTIKNSAVAATGADRFAIEAGGNADGYAPTSGLIVGNNILSSAVSHCLMIGYQVNGAYVSGNNVTGGDIGLIMKECQNVTANNNVVSGGTNTAFRFKAAVSCSAQYNQIANGTGGNCVSASAGDTGNKTQNCTFTRNTVVASGSSPVFAWVGDTGDAGGCVVDYNQYTPGAAKFGAVRADADVQTLAELQAAWADYDVTTNDANSTVG